MHGISVVTPSLNQGRFIERTIRSVLDQAYPRLEYVVCDPGSTDQTPAILERYAGCLRVIREPDTGQADAVNKGIRASSGEIIGWLNSDDVYLPGALSSVAALLASRPDVDVVYGDARLIDANDEPLGSYYTQPWNPDRLVERCFLCQPAVFFRRRVVDRFGFLDERMQYVLDYEYWLRLAAGRATFAYLPTPLAASRLHPETKTLSARLAVHQELNTMLRARTGRVPNSWLLNHAHTLVELRRVKRHRGPVPYAVDVVVQAVRLSLRWNRSVSPGLFELALRPITESAKVPIGRGLKSMW
jgi:glycosyltransferase involved in cell wall biosynthesis